MDAMGSPALSHNMSYAAAQGDLFYLVAGARRFIPGRNGKLRMPGAGARISELERRCLELGLISNDRESARSCLGKKNVAGGCQICLGSES
ncbi:unnamed protein product [Lactuca virosa]|uniref:Uncharacterized protein n=1 Tax=Lactuca virosa TaxID=75947 RepID=A0AAU9MFE7_9ASTR|nr:unnamed protein product [Lactuca virosa]